MQKHDYAHFFHNPLYLTLFGTIMKEISLCWPAPLQGAASLAARHHLTEDQIDRLSTDSPPLAHQAAWVLEPTSPAAAALPC